MHINNGQIHTITLKINNEKGIDARDFFRTKDLVKWLINQNQTKLEHLTSLYRTECLKSPLVPNIQMTNEITDIVRSQSMVT